MIAFGMFLLNAVNENFSCVCYFDMVSIKKQCFTEGALLLIMHVDFRKVVKIQSYSI